jgi:hypothetical protein
MEDSLLAGSIIAILLAYVVVVMVISITISIVMLISQWKINLKAGQPGWAILIPFYGLYIHTKVLQRPKYWFWLYLGLSITIIGVFGVLVMAIMDVIRLARVFGKSDGFTVGLILMPVIFIPILAFGDSQYQQLEN